MMDCPSCSQPLPDAASFCGHCGASLASEQECGGCGRSNPAEMRTGMQPALHEARGRLAALRGDSSGRERELGEARRMYTEMGAARHAERVDEELATLPS
jgi:primosomal protein N'